MPLSPARTLPRYDAVARALHWLVALLVAAQFVIGWTMPDVRRGTIPDGEIAWNIGVGSALIVVMALRVLWRITHRPPPEQLAQPLQLISQATHGALYAALIAVPVLGWLNSSVRDWPIGVFGVTFPALARPGSPVGHAIGNLHSAFAWVLFALIVLHVGAALFHRVVLKDHVLQRMLP